MKEEQVHAIFLLAGFPVTKTYKIENGYWPDVPDYAGLRRESPWWLVGTGAGLILIGWRKKVISIDWSDTAIRETITTDEVTKDLHMVHAWSFAKAVEYLNALRRLIPKPQETP